MSWRVRTEAVTRYDLRRSIMGMMVDLDLDGLEALERLARRLATRDAARRARELAWCEGAGAEGLQSPSDLHPSRGTGGDEDTHWTDEGDLL